MCQYVWQNSHPKRYSLSARSATGLSALSLSTPGPREISDVPLLHPLSSHTLLIICRSTGSGGGRSPGRRGGGGLGCSDYEQGVGMEGCLAVVERVQAQMTGQSAAHTYTQPQGFHLTLKGFVAARSIKRWECFCLALYLRHL